MQLSLSAGFHRFLHRAQKILEPGTVVFSGVVEAVNGNIKSLLDRGRGYTNLRYLLLKAQRMAAAKTEFVALKKAAKM